MIKSTHIIGSRDSGGAERFYSRLVCALQRSGAPTHAINPPGSSVAAQIGDCAPQTHIAMRGVWDLPSAWRIHRTVRKIAPDIVQTYMGRATRLTHIRPGRGPLHIARLGGYYNLKGYRHAHAWIGNTRGICDYLVKEGLPAERVAYIGNFVEIPEPTPQGELEQLRNDLAIPDDAIVVSSVGRLHPNKGFDTLLAAWATLPAELGGRPLHLLVAGNGPLAEELRKLADRLGIADRIHWAGWHADPGSIYLLGDLFVCPSRHEPLGNVILEAWAHERPVLATASQGAIELIDEGDNGRLVAIDDPAAMAAAIHELLLDEGGRHTLATAGRQRVTKHFSREVIVADYLAFYSSLLNARNRNSSHQITPAQ